MDLMKKFIKQLTKWGMTVELFSDPYNMSNPVIVDGKNDHPNHPFIFDMEELEDLKVKYDKISRTHMKFNWVIEAVVDAGVQLLHKAVYREKIMNIDKNVFWKKVVTHSMINIEGSESFALVYTKFGGTDGLTYYLETLFEDICEDLTTLDRLQYCSKSICLKCRYARYDSVASGKSTYPYCTKEMIKLPSDLTMKELASIKGADIKVYPYEGVFSNSLIFPMSKCKGFKKNTNMSIVLKSI